MQLQNCIQESDKTNQNQLHNYMTVPSNVVQESSFGSSASGFMP